MSALVEIGELQRARRLCEKLLSYASPLGLYGEELDPGTGRHLGNFPQAFTHLALINAVMHIIRAERRAAATEPLAPNMPEHREVPVATAPLDLDVDARPNVAPEPTAERGVITTARHDGH